MDFAVPIYIRNNRNIYYVLFLTCEISRSVHVKLVKNLTIETFLMAFRKHIATKHIAKYGNIKGSLHIASLCIGV